ncbi:MAG: hypothetical protein ACRDLK_14220, partial [Gaiellaceae bacterium]
MLSGVSESLPVGRDCRVSSPGWCCGAGGGGVTAACVRSTAGSTGVGAGGLDGIDSVLPASGLVLDRCVLDAGLGSSLRGRRCVCLPECGLGAGGGSSTRECGGRGCCWCCRLGWTGCCAEVDASGDGGVEGWTAGCVETWVTGAEGVLGVAGAAGAEGVDASTAGVGSGIVSGFPNDACTGLEAWRPALWVAARPGAGEAGACGAGVR